MGRSRTLKFILLAGSATLLQGCVAAVVPIAAGGLFGGASIDGEPDAAAPQALATAPAADPSVTVERSTDRVAMAEPEEAASFAAPETVDTPAGTMPPPAALAAATVAPATSPVAAERMPAPEPAPDPVPEPAPEEPALAIVVVDPDPEPVAAPEQSASFAEAFDAAPESPVEPGPVESSPIQSGLVEAEPTPEPVLVAGPAPEPTTSAAPLRVIAVNRQAAFGEGSSTSSNMSAAQAAAALSSTAPLEEPAAPSASLARTPRVPAPEPAPAAVPASEPTAQLAMTTEAAAPAMIPPPPPPPAPAPVPTPPRPLATGAFAELINYANRQQSRSAQNRASAVLADRASLQPDRAACNGSEATVLIDLDPDGDTFDPTLIERAAPGLPSALAQLRTAGVKIAWISANPVNQTGSIRDALNRSGLDIENADQLLLMRYPEDRKQTRREDLAANSCLVAIAGDTRTDFDELFEYLLNPQAAASLDPLMGNGWFLIPSPLALERPNP